MADTTQYTRDYTKWIEANHTTWQYTKDFTAWINKNYEKEIKSGKATLAKLQADKSVQERYTKETKNEPTESILSTLQANSDNQKKYTQTTGEEPIEIIRELKTSSKGKYGISTLVRFCYTIIFNYRLIIIKNNPICCLARMMYMTHNLVF